MVVVALIAACGSNGNFSNNPGQTGNSNDPTSNSSTKVPNTVVDPGPDAAIKGLPSAPDRDLYDLARALSLKSADPISRVVNPFPVSYEVGRRDTFRLTDILAISSYTGEAELRLVTPHAYWYVQDGLDISQNDLESASDVFEEEIYPMVTELFGTEWTPGIDNDPHLTILHASLIGVAGYFSSVDEYPIAVHEYSNQREMLYLNSASLTTGSDRYLAVLAHEFLHAVHFRADPTEETWVNEGLAELASFKAGYLPASQGAFVRSPTVSLVNWPLLPYGTSSYGADFLFFQYLVDHYGGQENIRTLIDEPLDGIPGINSYLAHLGHNETFDDVFANWAIANYLDEPGDGPYSYPENEVELITGNRVNSFERTEFLIPQYSAAYMVIDGINGDVRIEFEGDKTVSLLPIDLDGGSCWWGNQGDSISSTLTRMLDLTSLENATLEFRTWFDTEESWDFGYVQVSTDLGVTWDILVATGSSPRNPVGNSFGPGYTGKSDGWIDEEVDLTPYVGQEVLLRFQYVSDEAFNGIGICFDDIVVPELGFDDNAQDDDSWDAKGFLRIDNQISQEFVVRVVEVGEKNLVREMKLDENNNGELVIKNLNDLDEVVVVVSALAPNTRESTRYTLDIGPTP